MIALTFQEKGGPSVFPTIDQAKPGLKKLIAALGETYPYASVLAEADDRRDWLSLIHI